MTEVPIVRETFDPVQGPRRIESMGSVWEIDEDTMQYRRWPKQEKPRENGWGDETAGWLQDLVWHPMTQWGVHPRVPRLIIGVPDEEGHHVRAPLSYELWEQLVAEQRVYVPNP